MASSVSSSTYVIKVTNVQKSRGHAFVTSIGLGGVAFLSALNWIVTFPFNSSTSYLLPSREDGFWILIGIRDLSLIVQFEPMISLRATHKLAILRLIILGFGFQIQFSLKISGEVLERRRRVCCPSCSEGVGFLFSRSQLMNTEYSSEVIDYKK